MESIDTQIFLAWCEFKRFMGGQENTCGFAAFRRNMLRYREYIDFWISEGLKHEPSQD